MTAGQNKQLQAVIAQLQQAPAIVEQFSSQEGQILRAALDGQDVYAIAQQHRISEAAVWSVLTNAARAASGQSPAQVETGGFGSDTDPGVTGGYGETGFGSLGNEPPEPIPEEPPDERKR